MFFSLASFSDDPNAIKIPKIPTTEEIRKTLEAKSPISDYSLALFDTFTSGRAGGAMLRLAGPEAAQAPANQIIPMGSDRINSLVAAASAHVQSTGDAGFDKALDKLRVTAANMAFQAALYDGLRKLGDGTLAIPDFQALESYFKSLVDKRGDDGHFYALNREFLIAIALAQYEGEISLTLDHKLTEFAGTPAKHNAQGFKEAIELVAVEGREIVWKVAAKEVETRREFLKVQEKVRDGLAIKHFPHFRDKFTPEDFHFVLSLIDGKLRDLRFSMPVVNWCIQNARNANELLQLLTNELTDAVYIRFPVIQLNDPKANPFTIIPRQNDLSSAKVTIPEEPFFTEVMGAILLQAEQKFQVSRKRMLLGLTRHLIKAKPVSISFRFETLFRHIEILLAEGTHLEDWDSILVEMGALIAQEATNEESSLHACQEEWPARIQYLREEVVVRQKGWVPIHPRTFTEILRIINENAVLNNGHTPKDPIEALTLAAARRSLLELSSHVLTDVIDEAAAPGSKFLARGLRAASLNGCLVELVNVWAQIGVEEEKKD